MLLFPSAGYALYFLLCHTSFLGDPDTVGICRPPVQPTSSCVRSPIPIPLSAHTGKSWLIKDHQALQSLDCLISRLMTR